ncbi:MAG: PAS domain-containing protein [Halobacteria archaeon]
MKRKEDFNKDDAEGGVDGHRLLVETIDGYVDRTVDDETVREAYERVTDGFFSVDRDWQLTYINERAVEMLDANDDVIGERLWDVFPETEGTVFYEKAHEAVEEQRPVSFDGYYEPLESWYHVNAYPSEDGLSVYFRDVTVDVEREEELERHSQIVESCRDALWMFTADFEDVLFVNSAYEEVVGQPAEALDEDPTAFVDAAHPDDRDLLCEKMERAKDDDDVDFVVRGNPREGYERHLWVRGQPVYEDGELVAVSGFTRDITERVEREREAREMKERLDLAVEVADIGVWDWNVRTGDLDVNERWSRLIGRRNETEGMTVDDWESLVHPGDISDAWRDIEEHLDGDTEGYDIEFRMRDGEDGWRWIRSVGRVVERDEDGEPERAVGVHIDIDERKRNEKALERRNEYLSEIQDATRRMISATEADEVSEILVESASEVFENAGFYGWDDGVLRNGTEEVDSRDGGPAWEAFSRGEMVVTDADEGDEEVHGSRVDAPVGDEGVLSVEAESMPIRDSVICFLDSVTASAEASLERIEKESDLHGVAEKLRDRNDELRRLSEIDEVVRRLIKNVVDADSRDEIRRTVCERLLEVEGWDYAWFAEEGDDGIEATCCSDEGFTEWLVGSLDGSHVSKTLEDGEVRVVDDVARCDVSGWRRTVLDNGYLSSATVPVSYGSRRLGVLEVYSSETGSFEGGYTDALVDAAMVAGYAITAVEQMDALLSGGFNRLTVRIDGNEVDCVFSRLVKALDADFRVNGVASGDDGTLVYFRTEADDESLRSVAEEMGVELSETMNGYSATVEEMSVVGRARELGGRVSRYGPCGKDLEVDVDLPRERGARELLDAVSDEYPSTELMAKRSEDGNESDGEPLGDLTERQRTVLRLAHESGFFETPREKTGQELADSMDITATTFHQHLRSAEKKLVDAVLDA